MRKNSSKFWIGFRVYAAILLVLIVILLIYTYSSMKKYEKSQPTVVVNELIKDLENGDISSIELSVGNKFEEVKGFEEELASELKGSELKYEIKTTSYDKMSYDIVKDDEVIATVNLKADNHKEMFAILTICDWEIDSVSANIAAGTNSVSITIPDNYKAFINGVELGKDEQKGEAVEIADLSYVAKYTQVPKIITYEVNGLVNVPVVKVTDINGAEVDLSGYGDLTNINVGYPTSEIPAELEEYVVQAAKDYSNFFSKDLPGCSQSTDGIAKYFPADSAYIDLAENYRLNDMWMYSSHTGTEFRNLSVDDYTVYSETLFSCRVSFNKRMVLKNGQEIIEPNDQIYYYVKIDDKWLIAAMLNNTEK